MLRRDDAYSVLNQFIAVEITAKVRGIPMEVSLGAKDGLPKTCAANCDNLRTIAKANLVQQISRLPARRFIEVKRAVGYALGWEELIDADGPIRS